MKAKALVQAVKKDRTELLDLLWKYQNKHGYIRNADVVKIAKKLHISEVEVEGVLSFYHFFHREPKGKFIIYLNNSIVSEIKGYQRVKDAFERETATTFGAEEITGKFSLEETACIGLSDQEPAALINFYPFTNLNSLKVRNIIKQLKAGVSVARIADEIPDNVQHIPVKEKSVYFREYHPGMAVSKLADMTPDQVIDEIKKSKLSGMGGAFFPTGMKWDFCRKENSSVKYVVCNADEGEPGTFKDRVLMNNMPGLMLEGMILAGYSIGAKEGVVYLRAEYKWMLKKIQKTIRQFHRMNLLGKKIAGIKDFDFDIRVQLGAGAYVCGEETALLNSMEGKRGEPRTKMYFPTQRGFMDKPTVVNNVETFSAAARIIELGSKHFLGIGTKESPGTKLLSVSGDCHKPGIYEVEWGTSIESILKMCEADDPYFIQVSGPSGQCISMKEKKRKIAKEDLRCGGSFMIFNSERDILQILTNFSEFFKHESCGVCTPCRAGNFIIQRKLAKRGRGLTYNQDIEDMRNWGRIMSVTSRCGLGKAATNTLVSALDLFPEYFEKNLDVSGGVNISFDIEAATTEYEKFKS